MIIQLIMKVSLKTRVRAPVLIQFRQLLSRGIKWQLPIYGNNKQPRQYRVCLDENPPRTWIRAAVRACCIDSTILAIYKALPLWQFVILQNISYIDFLDDSAIRRGEYSSSSCK